MLRLSNKLGILIKTEEFNFDFVIGQGRHFMIFLGVPEFVCEHFVFATFFLNGGV